MTPITEFKNEFMFLSNFYNCWSVRRNGFAYPTLEHAFQVAKTEDPVWRTRILSCASPGAAKALGRVCPLREDWEEVKDMVMYGLVKEKFAHPSLRKRLIGTGDAWLVEGNWWSDRYWGYSFRHHEGQNELGRILMVVRQEI